MMYSVPCYNSAASIRFLLLPCTICPLGQQLDFSDPFCVSKEQSEHISVELHYHYATSFSLATYSSKGGTQGHVYLRSITRLMILRKQAIMSDEHRELLLLFTSLENDILKPCSSS